VPESLVYKPTAAPVSRTLIEAGAHLTAPSLSNKKTWYPWKSGIVAPVYTDCRRLAADPGATALLQTALSNAIRFYYPEVECIVGMAEAGMVWSTLVANALAKPHAFVRKQRKRHGTGALVEGNPPEGAKTVLVDDLTASGGSIEHAYRAITGEGQLIPIGVMTIVNWNFEEMRRRLSRLRVPVHSLTSYPELLGAAVETGRLSQGAAHELRSFYRSPQDHVWNLQALKGGPTEKRVA